MTDPDTAGTDPLVAVVTEAFRKAAVNGRIPSTREPLPFLSLADIAVAAVRAHQAATPSDPLIAVVTEALHEAHQDERPWLHIDECCPYAQRNAEAIVAAVRAHQNTTDRQAAAKAPPIDKSWIEMEGG